MPEGEHLDLAPTDFAALPGWRDDQIAAAVPALRRSCAVLARHAPDTAAGPSGTGLLVRNWLQPCAALATVPDGDSAAARAFFEQWFRPYRALANGRADGLFTGYYQPELHGALDRSARYDIPLYGRPTDLVTVDLGSFEPSLKGRHIAGQVIDGRLEPYPSRAEIEAGALAGRASALLWVDDPIELFFLQIQGSGRVVLPDGRTIQVGYVASNGRHYRSIGRILAERGALPLDQITLQSLKTWLRAHPRDAKSLMDQNASYVFFRESDGAEPIGAEGVPLTPGRSLAVDHRFIAYGVPVWLDVDNPSGGGRLQRLVIAQDTGGAITGPVRGDLFWGYGPEAEALAGRMRSRGREFLLLPRGAALQAQAGAGD